MARIKRREGLLPKQNIFVKKLIEGNSLKEASKIVGYSESYASTLLRKDRVRIALTDAGLDTKVLPKLLKRTITSGIGVKATNSDSIAGIRLAYELSGALDKTTPDNLTQNNIYINELKDMDDTTLASKVEELTKSIQELK